MFMGSRQEHKFSAVTILIISSTFRWFCCGSCDSSISSFRLVSTPNNDKENYNVIWTYRPQFFVRFKNPSGWKALIYLSEQSGREVRFGRGGRLFEAGRLLTFSAFRLGANSRLSAYSNKYGKRFATVFLGKVGKVGSSGVTRVGEWPSFLHINVALVPLVSADKCIYIWRS